MSKLKYIIIIIVTFAVSYFIHNLDLRCKSYPEFNKDKFNFQMKYDDIFYNLDTYNDIFSYGLAWDRDTVISYRVSDKLKREVYSILVDIDIYRYPENYAPTTTFRKLPADYYYLKYSFDSISYTINWRENTESTNRDAVKLRKLFRFIISEIENDSIINSLPPSLIFKL